MKKRIFGRDISTRRKKQWFTNFLIIAVMSIFIVGVGCATVGSDFPDYRVSRIKIGSTTQNDIRDMFGSPWRVGVEDGQQTWTYGRYRYSLFSETKTKDLVVRFDSGKVVTSFTYNTSEHGQ